MSLILTGDSAIDDDHRMILEALAQISDPSIYYSITDRMALLEKFLDYATKHLDREEKMMRKLDYPDYVMHRENHSQLQDAYMKIISDAVKGVLPHTTACATFEDIFFRHTETFDLPLGLWIQQQKK